MIQVVLGTVIIMTMAFLIGFAVAYLIKMISATLNYFENFNFAHSVTRQKRLYRIKKVRTKNLKYMLGIAQLETKDELLEHFYPQQSNKKENYSNENELTNYYYGKY